MESSTNETMPAFYETEQGRVAMALYASLSDLRVKSVEEKGPHFTEPSLEQLADEYTFDACARRAAGALVDLGSQMDTWEVTLQSESVYIVSGYGLGYQEGQLSYGRWYYYQATNSIEPISLASKELKDIITLEGQYTPKYTGVYPDDGLTCVHPERVSFIWKSQVPFQEGHYKAEIVITSVKQVDTNGDLTKAPPAVLIEADMPGIVYLNTLEYGTLYYWQVIESGYYNEFWGYYVAGGFVRHPIRSFKTLPEPVPPELSSWVD